MKIVFVRNTKIFLEPIRMLLKDTFCRISDILMDLQSYRQATSRIRIIQIPEASSDT